MGVPIWVRVGLSTYDMVTWSLRAWSGKETNCRFFSSDSVGVVMGGRSDRVGAYKMWCSER